MLIKMTEKANFVMFIITSLKRVKVVNIKFLLLTAFYKHRTVTKFKANKSNAEMSLWGITNSCLNSKTVTAMPELRTTS